MNLYKILWMFNSSVNYYLYRLKLLITEGQFTSTCQPGQRERRHEIVNLRMTTMSGRLSSKIDSRKNSREEFL